MGESYYALEKFAEMERNLIVIMEAMPIKRRAIDIYKQKNNVDRAKDTALDLEQLKNKLLDTIRTLRLLFLECNISEGAEYAGKLYGGVINYNLTTPDYTKLIAALQTLQKHIPQDEKATSALIGHLMNNVKMGYFPTDIAHVKMIKNALKFPDIKVNLLDPCCGEGIALSELAKDTKSATYGAEIDESRAKEAEKNLDRVGFGSYFHSRMSHEAFHGLFLNPPYMNVIGESGVKARSEKRFLVESMHHLMIGGILIYIVPYYRLTYDICRVICDNFKNVSVYRFLTGEFKKYNQVVVLGVRKKKEDGSEMAEKLSQLAMLPDRIPAIDTLAYESYALPDIEKKVDLFKGANFNLGELQRQLATSKSIDMLFEKSKIDAMEKRPLLPLNISQVGLIGGSGLINGYVECEKAHIIKGRVIKEIKKYEDENTNTMTETRVNRMLFNVLTPKGLKRLA